MDQYQPRSASRRHPSPAVKQPLPRLIRSKSEHPATSPLITAALPNKSNTAIKSRSKSTAKVRNYKEAEGQVNSLKIYQTQMTINTIITTPSNKKKPAQDVGGSRDGTFGRFLPRKKPTSPSAWALSPGRALPCSTVVPPKSPSPGGKATGNGGGGGIGVVLKYFRQKKTVSLEDANRHCFKVINNRLLQWRFANVRAATTMTAVKLMAENKIFNAWIKILSVRNSNMAKRIEVQKLKNEIKLYHIMNSQLFLLEKWSRLEAKNLEAVNRVVRKLSAASVNLPLVHDSKGDVLALCDSLDTTTGLLENIESTIKKLYYKAEQSCYLLTELSIITKQEKEALAELQTWMLTVASLKPQTKNARNLLRNAFDPQEERSLTVHLIQFVNRKEDLTMVAKNGTFSINIRPSTFVL